MDKETAIFATAAVFVLVILTAIGTWGITRKIMRTDAMAYGVAHWIIVDGYTAFAWGPSPE